MFPYFVPNVERAIYLDVDLIVMDDIRKLWDIDLEGHVFGASPLYVERLATINMYKNKIGLSEQDTSYHYFNSGILLIDYKKWRELKNNDNQNIINELFEIINSIYTDCTPDELVLNKFAFLNGGYKELPQKFNVQSYYCYNYLQKNTEILDERESWTLNEYKKHEKKYDYKTEESKFDGIPSIRHFYGTDKPWNSITQWVFPIPSQNFT